MTKSTRIKGISQIKNPRLVSISGEFNSDLILYQIIIMA